MTNQTPFETKFPDASGSQLVQLRAMEREAPARTEFDFKELPGGNIEVIEHGSAGTARTVVDRDGVYVEESFTPNVNGRWNRFVYDLLKGGAEVPLVSLRTSLMGHGTTRSAQDQHLKRMDQEGLIKLTVMPRPKQSQDDKETAIKVAGKLYHLARWTGAKPR